MRFEERNEPLSDVVLIERTLGGDEAAFEVLVDRYQRKIYRVAFAILRNEMDADLVAQDTFVQAYLHLAKFERRSELETWLTRIAINRSRDALRTRRWIPLSTSKEEEDAGSIPEPIDPRPDAQRQAISHQLHDAIERAIETLSAQQKTIFRLRHYEGLPLEEIASHLDLRAGTVRAHLFRAVHKVRKELASWVLPSKDESL